MSRRCIQSERVIRIPALDFRLYPLYIVVNDIQLKIKNCIVSGVAIIIFR